MQNIILILENCTKVNKEKLTNLISFFFPLILSMILIRSIIINYDIVLVTLQTFIKSIQGKKERLPCNKNKKNQR